MSNYIPTVKWHQSNGYIFLIFEVHNAQSNKIEINNDEIIFDVSSNQIHYSINIELNKNIVKEESTYSIDEKSVKMVLKKECEESWNYLTKDKNQYRNNIKINWDLWMNDDSDPEENANYEDNIMQQFDFRKMMESMGGIDGMNGGGDMEYDEDAEDDAEDAEEYTGDEDNLNSDNEYGDCNDEEEYCTECNA